MRGLLRLLPWLIVPTLTACDNFQWGGIDVDIVPPPPSAIALANDTTARDERVVRDLPEGPVLYHVMMVGNQPRIRPVAEITGDTLTALAGGEMTEPFATRFIADRLRMGSEFTLYRRGVRAGTFVSMEAQPVSSGTCAFMPVATGALELAAGQEPASEYLAIGRLYAPETPSALDIPLEPDRRMQVIAPILAERLLRARGAQLPGNWQRAMQQLQPFPAAETRDAGFAATFLVDDTLGPGFDNEGHSLFFIGAPVQLGFDTAFTRFANYPEVGKAAPRVIDFLDWNRDGRADLLLEVYGVDGSWYETVGSVDGEWRRTFVDTCRRRPERAIAAAPADTTS